MKDRQFSDGGFVAVKDTNAIATGRYSGFLVSEEAVIAAIEFLDGYDGDSGIVGMTLPAGFYRPMLFSTITLTSGKGFAEKL